MVQTIKSQWRHLFTIYDTQSLSTRRIVISPHWHVVSVWPNNDMSLLAHIDTKLLAHIDTTLLAHIDMGLLAHTDTTLLAN